MNKQEQYKKEREQILFELRDKCNKIFIDNNLKSRLEIIYKNGEAQFKLNTEPKEFPIAYQFLKEELKSLGLDQVDAELKKG